MRNGMQTTIVAMCVAFGLAACGERAPTDEPAAPAAGALPSTSVEHTAEGTFNSIDQAAGTANISHGPVESARWPAMTMNFKLAEPESAAQLRPGERIRFRFTVEGGSAIVTGIAPAE